MATYILAFIAGAAVASAFLTLHYSKRSMKEAERRLHEAQESLRIFQEQGKDRP